MNFLALAKLGKALFLFVREMWLRDRTFRQFVHENLALVVSTSGFLMMTVLFTHVYFIVLDQEKEINEHEKKYTRLREEYDYEIPFLTEKMEWYRDRYLELKAPPVESARSHGPSRRSSQGSAKETEPTPKSTAPVISDDDVVERWNRLGE